MPDNMYVKTKFDEIFWYIQTFSYVSKGTGH